MRVVFFRLPNAPAFLNSKFVEEEGKAKRALKHAIKAVLEEMAESE